MEKVFELWSWEWKRRNNCQVKMDMVNTGTVRPTSQRQG